MNKTVIEWTDFTWNPVTGCKHPCRNQYCYNTMKSSAPLNRFGAKYRNDDVFRFEKDWKSRETGGNHIAEKGEIYPFGYDPTFYPHRLDEPTKRRNPAKIFAVDTGDLFGEWVPSDWIESVLQIALDTPQHTFQFLTKNPERMNDFTFPTNAWCGTSVNSDQHADRIETLRSVSAPIRFLSIEPIMGSIRANLSGIDWVIIGAMTGNNAKRPNLEWVTSLRDRCIDNHIPVFMKSNLNMISAVKEFPQIALDDCEIV